MLKDENVPVEEISGNIEIQQALKEFELKSNVEEQQKSPETLKISEIPKMVQLVMKYSGGAIKEQKTAEYVLLGFVVLAIGVSLYLFFGINGSGKSSSIDKAALDQMMPVTPGLN